MLAMDSIGTVNVNRFHMMRLSETKTSCFDVIIDIAQITNGKYPLNASKPFAIKHLTS
jgi:hypothetical protein